MDTEYIQLLETLIEQQQSQTEMLSQILILLLASFIAIGSLVILIVLYRFLKSTMMF